MNCCHKEQVERRRQRAQGWSLVETMVATSIAAVLALGSIQVMVYTAYSFAALGNYADLDRTSRNALDQMSRDIRMAKVVQYYSTNSVTLTNLDGTVFSYAWDGSNSVTRTWGGTDQVILTGCDYFCLEIWQRNPTNGFWFPYSASNQPALAKLVNVSWKCSRKILQQKVNTESVQTAKIVLRN
jgi:type II secretory pathway component PulJ